jgi:hypothetical protein
MKAITAYENLRVPGLANSKFISSSEELEGSTAFGSGRTIIGRASGALGALFPKSRALTTHLGRVVGSEKSENKNR